jgi:tRNA-guanine family transglycosylase
VNSCFEVLASDPSSLARRGRLRTRRGVVETPIFMPVGTQGTVKAVSPRELRDAFPLRVELLLEADRGYVTLVPKKLLPIEEATA